MVWGVGWGLFFQLMCSSEVREERKKKKKKSRFKKDEELKQYNEANKFSGVGTLMAKVTQVVNGKPT